MDPLLSAKGGDVTAWRAVEDFTASYRQALLDRAASDLSGSAETVFSDACAAVEAAITTHQNLVKRLDGLIERVASAAPATNLAEPTAAFYSELYRHFGTFRSAPVFYQLSMAFLKQLCAAVITQAADRLALPPHHLPEMALIALGPAGRCEYSPFSPLQILLVHGEATVSQLQTIDRFCTTLHAGFEAAGLAIDPVVTPRTACWRGTLTDWRNRFDEALHPHADADKLIDLGRLVDQYPLHAGDGFARELKQVSGTVLRGSRPALANIVERMTSLSNGLGFMGRLKLERSGSERALFRLVDYGLLPLSAALSTLALITESRAVGACERINDLLRSRELDVELAERMLAAWYFLHDLRLWLEQSFRLDEPTTRPLLLDPNDLTVERQQALKKHLESVAAIQLHVAITFSGMGE